MTRVTVEGGNTCCFSHIFNRHNQKSPIADNLDRGNVFMKDGDQIAKECLYSDRLSYFDQKVPKQA